MTHPTLRRLLKSLKALAAPAAVLGAVGALALVDDGAQAQVAAKIESQTRPNFGLLLQPPVQARPRGHRRWSYGTHRGHGYAPPPPRPTLEEVVLVDCGGNPGTGAVEAAVHRVRPGGTLIIRARGGPCVGWLNVDKPMTILGDGQGFDPRDWNRNPAPTLQAPDGLPCVTIAPGVRVEIRDVVFASPNAGDAACVVNYGGQAILNRVGFRHAGDEAAIYSDGGLVDLRNAVIEADTVSAAVVGEGATLTAYETTILRALSGVDLTPGPGEPSLIQNVTMRGTEAPNNFGPRAIGLIVRAQRDYGRVEVTNTLISDYAEGVAVEGASVLVRDTRITRVDKGAVLYNGELTLDRSRVRADTVGVAAAAGRAVVTNNVFARVRQVYYEEARAIVDAEGNVVYSRALCRAQFRPRYRDRYEPYFGAGGPGWRCAYDSYPQDWWRQEDGYFGYGYEDDGGYYLDGYDRYQQGYGWYDRDGRYIRDDRYHGDRRWSGGGWRR